MAFVQMKTAEGYAKLTHDAARLFGIVLTSPTDQVADDFSARGVSFAACSKELVVSRVLLVLPPPDCCAVVVVTTAMCLVRAA
jgi:hypothetical protein